jgi:predicted PurR-regulated permease PerM
MSAVEKLTPGPERTSRRTLWILAGVLVLSALALLSPFWPSLLLALWTSALAKPLVLRVTRAIGGRRRAAALVTVGLLILGLAPVVTAIALVAPDAIDLGQRALASKSGYGAVVELVSGHEHVDAGAQTEKVLQVVQSHGKEAWSVAAVLAGITGHVALGVLIFFVATFAAMAQGSEAYVWVRARLPISPRDTDRLRDAFQETGRGLLYSVGLTALLIAIVATIVYLSLGLPRAFALGLVTLVAALIPAVGPFLVWGPVSLGLLLAGHPIKAAVLAGVCIAVIAPIDHFVRPYLAKLGKLQLNPVLVFLAMFGGAVSLGGFGLMLGPLVFRLAGELLAIVHEEVEQPRQAPARSYAPSADVLARRGRRKAL